MESLRGHAQNAPTVKREAVKGYGAEVILCESTLEAREATSQSIVNDKGAAFLHPSNQMEVFGQCNATPGITGGSSRIWMPLWLQ